MSFRLRLLGASLATIAVGLGALLVLGNVLLDQRVEHEASTTLKAAAEAQVSALDVTPHGVTVRATANDDTLDRRSWVLSGDRVIERPEHVPAKLDRAAVALGRARRTAETEPVDDIRIRAVPVTPEGGVRPVGAVVVSYSVKSLERLQKLVLVGSLVICALVLLAGALAIRSAVDGALRPVAQMTESAREWGAHDLERRFGLGPARDELTALAATLDGLLARIAASRRHEQRFAAEVAHELKTPLAGLQLQAELALKSAGEDGDAERRTALEHVIEQTRRLNEVVETLLGVARAEIDAAGGAVDLGALAHEIDGAEVIGNGELPLAEGDPDVVRRALAPLVDNARRHARERVWLELSAAGGRVRLGVRDDGDGVDPALGERVFDAGVRGDASGAGLGLPLARRMARSCGGDVRLGDGPGGDFVLELPALSQELAR